MDCRCFDIPIVSVMKEIFFTEKEMQIIRVCLNNAPCPYDVGEGAKAVKNLIEKAGEPEPLEGEPLVLQEYDLSQFKPR
mgnify:CR=1 FL=1